MVIVTGAEPQLNVMTPPAATAATTAADVQLAGVPLPITWSGWLVSAGWPAAGTVAFPAGLPAASGAPPWVVAGVRDAVARAVVVPCACDGALAAVTTAEATATGAPAAGAVGATAGTALEEAPGTALVAAPGTAPAHAVTVAIAARQPIPVKPRTSTPKPRIDLMAHDASALSVSSSV
jgi:hypothetical protein